MTPLELALYRRRTLLFILAALLFLGGAVMVAFLQIRHESNRADQLATEADLRGTAVSTLAGDVRALRSQVQAAGKTPVAPDPARAIPSLPDRTAVPVPIPGPPGAPGADSTVPGPTGPSGSPGADSTVPGPTGPVGADSNVPGPQGPAGADSTVPGPKGDKGDQGEPGLDGKDGASGQTCPDGYSLQPPPDDPYALVCRQDGAPDPTPSPTTTPPALLPDRRRT